MGYGLGLGYYNVHPSCIVNITGYGIIQKSRCEQTHSLSVQSSELYQRLYFAIYGKGLEKKEKKFSSDFNLRILTEV